jgi:parallel beta-helix repeat protein
MKVQRTLRKAGGLAVVVAGALALAAPGAQAAAVTCGQVIAANTVVSNDLTNCPGDGLVIGANGIVLDLNGHTITGTDNGNGIVIGTHNHVTVKNGRVAGFTSGIYVNGPDNTVSKITSKNNSYDGVYVDNADRFRMTSSWTIGNSSNGVESSDSSNGTYDGVQANGNGSSGLDIYANSSSIVGTTITQSTANGNGNDGIYLYNVRFVSVTKNTLNGNYSGFYSVFTNGTGSVISGNKATDNSQNGFYLAFANGFTFTGNRASNNLTGFYDDYASSSNTYDGNLATGNAYGFQLYQSTNSVLRNNTAGASQGTSGAGGGNQWGIYVTSSSGAVISDNKAHGNKVGDGIYVDSGSSGTTIRRNQTNRNHHDGINDADTSSTVVQNVADFNLNFGIESAGTDGGGNEAHGNGAGQCSGVSC